MLTHKIKVTITADHQLTVTVPDNFPEGPAEVIIQSNSSTAPQIVKLAGVLTPYTPLQPNEDPIANVLQEFRTERQQRLGKLQTDVGGQEES
jgi:hypothetical protein